MKLRFLFLFLAAFALASCGGNSADSHTHGEETHTHAEDGHDHDHDGHMHDGEEASEAAAMNTHMEGQEYTSTYICPMHCEGSGSEEAGTCPVCGMDYVLRSDHIKDGHMHE